MWESMCSAIAPVFFNVTKSFILSVVLYLIPYAYSTLQE
jgi:hypothetical protein